MKERLYSIRNEFAYTFDDYTTPEGFVVFAGFSVDTELTLIDLGEELHTLIFSRHEDMNWLVDVFSETHQPHNERMRRERSMFGVLRQLNRDLGE